MSRIIDVAEPVTFESDFNFTLRQSEGIRQEYPSFDQSILQTLTSAASAYEVSLPSESTMTFSAEVVTEMVPASTEVGLGFIEASTNSALNISASFPPKKAIPAKRKQQKSNDGTSRPRKERSDGSSSTNDMSTHGNGQSSSISALSPPEKYKVLKSKLKALICAQEEILDDLSQAKKRIARLELEKRFLLDKCSRFEEELNVKYSDLSGFSSDDENGDSPRKRFHPLCQSNEVATGQQMNSPKEPQSQGAPRAKAKPRPRTPKSLPKTTKFDGQAECTSTGKSVDDIMTGVVDTMVPAGIVEPIWEDNQSFAPSTEDVYHQGSVSVEGTMDEQ